MRLRLISLAAAAALGMGTLAAVPQPAAATTTPVLFGLIDHWKTEITNDDTQLQIHSGIVGLFTQMAVTSTQRDTVVRWFDWVRSRGAAPMIDLVPPSSATLGAIANGRIDGTL